MPTGSPVGGRDLQSGGSAGGASAVAWIKRLIAFDTTSRNSNLDLIADVEAYLRSFGLSVWLTHDDDGRKANLFATLPGADGETDGGIILSGHTDVVPVDGQDWTSDPFTPEVRDDRLYGRGACDMKGFLGTALSLVPQWAALPLRRPLHLALSYDEELGCLGAPRMIQDLKDRGLRPESCIVGEPTSMKPVIAHKGLRHYRCRVHGRAAHSSRTPAGVNAIEYAARIVVRYRQLIDAAREGSVRDEAFDVPFTTGSVGLIHGGTADNIVPETCEFSFECRPIPGFDVDGLEEQLRRFIAAEVLPAMKAEHPDSRVELDRLYTIPGLAESDRAELRRLVEGLLGNDAPHKVAYATEGGQFSEAGIHTLICGPGDIAQAHRPDEFVSLDQVAACERFLTGVARSLAS